jgi:ribosomal protein S18 acetylase RimI-like enzyme
VPEPASSQFVANGGELRLSNPAQLELLRGTAARGVSLRTAVRGFSMAPFVRDGDVVTIVPMGGREPRVGDVVALAMPTERRMAVHRVVARVPPGWIVQGDNCPLPDGVFPRDAFVGLVTRVERCGRIVRLGLGKQGELVAALSRRGWLLPLWRVVRAPRVGASGGLRAAQSLPAYRRLGRRWAPAVEIGPATPVDEDDLRRHFRLLDSLTVAPLGDGATRLVAKRRGHVVGYVELVHNELDAGPWAGDWLFALMVKGRYRGLGIGEKLMNEVLALARQRGVRELRLTVNADDRRATRFYAKMGFVVATLPALVALLERERATVGRRRVLMRVTPA